MQKKNKRRTNQTNCKGGKGENSFSSEETMQWRWGFSGRFSNRRSSYQKTTDLTSKGQEKKAQSLEPLNKCKECYDVLNIEIGGNSFVLKTKALVAWLVLKSRRLISKREEKEVKTVTIRIAGFVTAFCSHIVWFTRRNKNKNKKPFLCYQSNFVIFWLTNKFSVTSTKCFNISSHPEFVFFFVSGRL